MTAALEVSIAPRRGGATVGRTNALVKRLTPRAGSQAGPPGRAGRGPAGPALLSPAALVVDGVGPVVAAGAVEHVHLEHLLDELGQGQAAPGARRLGRLRRGRLRGTILLSDARGFTRMRERLPPVELATLLREFREMTLAVFEEQGTLDKFIDDGLMAVFGAPVPVPDAAARAVRCALRILERLAALNARSDA